MLELQGILLDIASNTLLLLTIFLLLSIIKKTKINYYNFYSTLC